MVFYFLLSSGCVDCGGLLLLRCKPPKNTLKNRLVKVRKRIARLRKAKAAAWVSYSQAFFSYRKGVIKKKQKEELQCVLDLIIHDINIELKQLRIEDSEIYQRIKDAEHNAKNS